MSSAHQRVGVRLGWPVYSGTRAESLSAEQAAVRKAVNATAGRESGRLLHEGFFAKAMQQPELMALAWGKDHQLSYGELASRARRVARLLVNRGLVPGESVAITLPKGPGQVEAALGVAYAGAAYVPVGVNQPAQRRARMYANAGIRFVMTASANRCSLEWPDGVEVLVLEDASTLPPAEAPAAVPPESLAYIIYTSGSTGEPKGVEISHRAAVNTVEDINSRFAVCEGDRVLSISALDFDLSVYDIFGLLAAGGAVVVVEEHERGEPHRWSELVRGWGVTVWNSVPALLDVLLATTAADGLGSSLRVALVSGDWIGLDLPGRLWARAPQCRFIALGGATEAAIWSNAYEVTYVSEHWRSIPYGYPLRNQCFRVVDDRGRDCPYGTPGELWIGGVGVAAGYRGNPDATARQFVEYEGKRWYRTGDLGQYWPDGTLEFLGRRDHQVKIRGHRVELGEIEAALKEHPKISQVVASTFGEREPRLIAFVVPTDSELDRDQLGTFLARRLPSYAVPSAIHVVEKFPLNANGKIDRAALARLRSLPATTPDDPPQGPTEIAISKIWAELLGVPSATRNESFVAMGGDSLTAPRFLAELHRRLGVDLSLQQLYAAPTVAELASLIAEQEQQKSGEGN